MDWIRWGVSIHLFLNNNKVALNHLLCRVYFDYYVQPFAVKSKNMDGAFPLFLLLLSLPFPFFFYVCSLYRTFTTICPAKEQDRKFENDNHPIYVTFPVRPGWVHFCPHLFSEALLFPSLPISVVHFSFFLCDYPSVSPRSSYVEHRMMFSIVTSTE